MLNSRLLSHCKARSIHAIAIACLLSNTSTKTMKVLIYNYTDCLFLILLLSLKIMISQISKTLYQSPVDRIMFSVIIMIHSSIYKCFKKKRFWELKRTGRRDFCRKDNGGLKAPNSDSPKGRRTTRRSITATVLMSEEDLTNLRKMAEADDTPRWVHKLFKASSIF